MIIFTSSKGQNFSPITPALPPTVPEFEHKALQLNALLGKLNLAELRKLMAISEPLGRQTQDRIAGYAVAKRKPALFTYSGEAFRSLDAAGFTTEDLDYAQTHFCILSGLYGILRPLDLMAPHRLEMGCKLGNQAGGSLYPFWKQAITAHLNKAMEENNCQWLFNLASLEYSKVLDKALLCRPLLDIHFKESSKDGLKTVAVFSKRARGMMANFLIKNKITTKEDATCFTGGGYCFRADLSKNRLIVFTRPQPF